MDATLHRIEALPGAARYAVTWVRADGSEQTAVVHALADRLDVAEASLPSGCTPGSGAFEAVGAAVRAFEAARATATAPRLRDVDGGWDVSLGNVALDESGTPACSAHGPMQATPDGEYACIGCGARAVVC